MISSINVEFRLNSEFVGKDQEDLTTVKFVCSKGRHSPDIDEEKMSR
jgi:hypothetical protein